jgi:hypothetical protein
MHAGINAPGGRGSSDIASRVRHLSLVSRGTGASSSPRLVPPPVSSRLAPGWWAQSIILKSTYFHLNHPHRLRTRLSDQSRIIANGCPVVGLKMVKLMTESITLSRKLIRRYFILCQVNHFIFSIRLSSNSFHESETCR